MKYNNLTKDQIKNVIKYLKNNSMYNISINEVKMKNKSIKTNQKTTRDLLIEFIEDQNKRWDRQEKFNKILLSLPTIKREIKKIDNH